MSNDVNFSGNFSLYEQCIYYAKYLLKSSNLRIEAEDIVHDLLISTDLTIDNYRSKIKGAFYKEKEYKSQYLEFNEFGNKKIEVELIPCKYCNRSLPEYSFRTITNKEGIESKFYTCCEYCEPEFNRKNRQKSVSLLKDSYINELLLRHGYIKKRSDIRNEDIEIRRTEIFLTRISKCFKYKDYGKVGKRKTNKRPKILS